MELKPLLNLSPLEYEHPFDSKALNTLENTKGLSMVVKKFYELGIERVLKLQFIGSCMKVTASSMPELYGIFREACHILNLPDTPELYVQLDQDFQCTAWGVDQPIVVISSEAVEKLSDGELLFVLGRAIGHIKSRHVLYLEIGYILPELAEAFSAVTLGIGGLVSIGLRYALFYWIQMANYTADRAGLLACQDIKLAMKVLAKEAGLPSKYWDQFNLDDFITQARAFEGFDEKTFDKVLKFFFKNRLWAMARANELVKWTEAGSFQNVMERKTELKAMPEASAFNFCPSCGFKLEEAAKFCPNCGNKL